MFGMLSKCSGCLHLACHLHSCSMSLERVGRSSKSSQQVVLEGTKITTHAHLHNMILDDEEGDQVCLAYGHI